MGKLKGYKSAPEEKILQAVVRLLRAEQWFVMRSHGNMFQFGWPDLFACHTKYRQRWIEVKNPLAYHFTKAQLDTFPKLCSNGSAVWVLVAATADEYAKLFQPCNWYQYLSVLK